MDCFGAIFDKNRTRINIFGFLKMKNKINRFLFAKKLNMKWKIRFFFFFLEKRNQPNDLSDISVWFVIVQFMDFLLALKIGQSP